MARPKKLTQTFPLPSMPDYMQADGADIYDTRFMSVDELAAQLFAVDAYPDCSSVEYVKKNIESMMRRNSLPHVRLLPGLPTERISRHRAPWCIPRAAAEDWIRQATRESIARKEAARQNS